VQAWLVRNAVRLQKEALQFTDERSKLEGELLNGMDVVKCNSWEVLQFLLLSYAILDTPRCSMHRLSLGMHAWVPW
jgi:hypothetical protein